MVLARALCAILVSLTWACTLAAQEVPVPQLFPGSQRTPAPASSEPAQPEPPRTVALIVAKGSPLQVALDREVRVERVGQPVHARIVEPVYALDHIVVPAGSEVIGYVTRIEAVSGGKRTLAALNADFTPLRKVEVSFHELVLADGRRFPLHANVTPGSGQVIELVTAANAPKEDKKNGVKDLASERTKQAKQQARQQWDDAMKQLKTPGKMRRLERYGEAQMPVHRQFIPAGTVYFAELEDPLDFGSEQMAAPAASSIGAIPEGSVVHARLVTPLSSATSHQGQDVEAVLSQPLMDGERLILPQGSRLKGTVRQAQPARRMKRNGQLRIAFSELVPPDGMGQKEQKVVATLEGVQAGRNANVKLDSEGGAEATTSKSRYLATTVSIGLAGAGVLGDNPLSADNTGGQALGGANGFKVVGLVVGALARSRAFGITTGAYGAAASIYSHFIARGREVEFPKNTAMQIGIGTRVATAATPAQQEATPAAPSESADLVH
jgi:type IV secretory pathway VirB10-like protein